MLVSGFKQEIPLVGHNKEGILYAAWEEGMCKPFVAKRMLCQAGH